MIFERIELARKGRANAEQRGSHRTRQPSHRCPVPSFYPKQHRCCPVGPVPSKYIAILVPSRPVPSHGPVYSPEKKLPSPTVKIHTVTLRIRVFSWISLSSYNVRPSFALCTCALCRARVIYPLSLIYLAPFPSSTRWPTLTMMDHGGLYSVTTSTTTRLDHRIFSVLFLSFVGVDLILGTFSEIPD